MRAQAESAGLSGLATSLVSKIPEALILVYNKKLFPNIRWTDLTAQTDLFDYEVLVASGLSSEWRAFNIWYRQVMRSSGSSAKDRAISKEFALGMMQS